MPKAHIDRGGEIDGVKFDITHSGQKQRYGDTFYEYDVRSDRPRGEVRRVCCEQIYPAISAEEWRELNKENPSSANHFKPHYKFTSTGEPGRYFYQVTLCYAD